MTEHSPKDRTHLGTLREESSASNVAADEFSDWMNAWAKWWPKILVTSKVCHMYSCTH